MSEKCLVPKHIEMLGVTNENGIDCSGKIVIYSHLTLEDVLLGYLAKMKSEGVMEAHCFIISEAWIDNKASDRMAILGAHHWLPIFTFLDLPVYLVEELNTGISPVAGAGMGWRGVTVIPK